MLEMLDLCRAVRHGSEPIASAVLGVDVLRAVEAVDRSLKLRGQPVKVAGGRAEAAAESAPPARV